MEFLDQFGFNLVLFVAQVINFLILFFILKKFLFGPVMKTIKDREKTIQQGLKDADKARVELEAAEAEREKIIKKASAESQGILADTKKTADELKASILHESRDEADRIISQAKTEADSQMEKMRKEARGISLEMSQRILDNVLTGLFSKKEKDEVLKRGNEQIKKYGQTK